MRYAVISDVHANEEALEVVLADAAQRACDRIVCLGDFVGYGPNPNECVERLRPLLDGRAVAGNHDWAAIGKLDVAFFNVYARQAILWTQQALQAPVRDYLAALPTQWSNDDPLDFLAVHGSPRDPIEEYVLDTSTARTNFHERTFSRCFIGHSHVPGIFIAQGNVVEAHPFPPAQGIRLEREFRYLINVGSVGQPRDGDPRAAYAVLDIEAAEVTLIRLEYPVGRTQEKMHHEGLPPMLAERLSYGR